MSDEPFYTPPCPRCAGERWICEQHPDRPWPHDDCAGPGEPCPVCNTSEPPEMPEGFISLAKVNDDER
jgi:hypothetical protein